MRQNKEGSFTEQERESGPLALGSVVGRLRRGIAAAAFAENLEREISQSQFV